MVVAKVSALVPRAVGDTTTTVTARELPLAGVTTVQLRAYGPCVALPLDNVLQGRLRIRSKRSAATVLTSL